MVEKYKDYISGDEWLDRSRKYLLNHSICEICHKHTATQAHHNSYARSGEELDEDITALCDRCHLHLHIMPPMINDPEQLRKAMQLIDDFRNYPKLKTLILNDISEKFFNGRFMMDVAKEYCSETAFFSQNILEIFYQVGLERNVDIIEEATKVSFKLKVEAGKNAFSSKKDSIARKEKYENGELKYVDLNLTTTKKPELTIEELIKERKKSWMLHFLRDKETLARAKSFANINYYNGKIFFNREGIYTAEQFFLKLRSDNLIDRLFVDMGGVESTLLEEIDK